MYRQVYCALYFSLKMGNFYSKNLKSRNQNSTYSISKSNNSMQCMESHRFILFMNNNNDHWSKEVYAVIIIPIHPLLSSDSSYKE